MSKARGYVSTEQQGERRSRMVARDDALVELHTTANRERQAHCVAEEESDEAHEALDRLDTTERLISDTPAQGVRGVLIKLGAAERYESWSATFREHPNYVTERLILSAMEDLRRLSGPCAKADGFTEPYFNKDQQPEEDYWQKAIEQVGSQQTQHDDHQIDALWQERERRIADIETMKAVEPEKCSENERKSMIAVIMQRVRDLDERIIAIEPDHWMGLCRQAAILALCFHRGSRKDELAAIVARRLVRWTNADRAVPTTERVMFSAEWQAKATQEAVKARLISDERWNATQSRASVISERAQALRKADAERLTGTAAAKS